MAGLAPPPSDSSSDASPLLSYSYILCSSCHPLLLIIPISNSFSPLTAVIVVIVAIIITTGVSLTLVSSFPLRSSPVAQDLHIILKWPVVEEHQPRPWPLPGVDVR